MSGKGIGPDGKLSSMNQIHLQDSILPPHAELKSLTNQKVIRFMF